MAFCRTFSGPLQTANRTFSTRTVRTSVESDNGWPHGSVRAPRIGIVVGKKNGKLALKYALQNVVSPGGLIHLLHVQIPPRSIPKGILRKRPIKHATAEAIQEYKHQLRQEAESLVNEYKETCNENKVKTEVFYTESDTVQKGLVDQITKLGLTTLVVAKSSKSAFSRAKKVESISTFVATHAPSFCKVLVIHRGKLHSVRNASESSRFYVSSRLSTTSAAGTDVGSVCTTVMGKWMTETFQAHSMRLDSIQNHNDNINAVEESIDARLSALWGELESGYQSIVSPSISDHTSIKQSLPGHEHALTSSNTANNESSPAASDFHLWLDEAERFADWLNQEAQRQATILKKITSSARKMHAEHERHLGESMSALETARGMVDQCLVDVGLAKHQAETEKRRYEEAVNKLDEVCKMLEDEYHSKKEAEEKLELEHQLRKEAERKLKVEYQLREEAEKKASKEASEKSKALVALGEGQQQFAEYSYQELQSATNMFSDDNNLGGSYGLVFRGKLHRTIAVKVLAGEGLQGCVEFRNEIELLSRIHHPHIVKLLGACVEKGCIVYEYMENGSLDDSLHCKNGAPAIPWYTRFQICIEVAAALVFLHSCAKAIIHGDLNARNILLGNHFASKISSVGLTKLAASNMGVHKGKMPLGMYIHPDYQFSGIVSCESDVFSLGIVMLQLLTGRPAAGVSQVVEDAVYNGCLEDVLDKSAGEWPLAEAMELAFVGLQCADPRKKNRPSLYAKVIPDLQKLQSVASAAAANMSNSAGPSTNSITPSIFICPLSQKIMEDPSIAADGFTYEHSAIKAWFQGHDTSPMTNLELHNKFLIPNHTLRLAIKEWYDKGNGHERSARLD